MTRCSGEILACLSVTKWPSRPGVTLSCSFDDVVREALRLFPNVPKIKEKQKKCLKLLLKTKDPTGFGKSLIYLACVAVGPRIV